MSTMLEKAIVDAAALKEAALKNAEATIIEKYAPQIKDAVSALLEQEEDELHEFDGGLDGLKHSCHRTKRRQKIMAYIYLF